MSISITKTCYNNHMKIEKIFFKYFLKCFKMHIYFNYFLNSFVNLRKLLYVIIFLCSNIYYLSMSYAKENNSSLVNDDSAVDTSSIAKDSTSDAKDLTDPVVGRLIDSTMLITPKCHEFLKEREEKIGHKEKIQGLIFRNSKLQNKLPENRKTLLVRLQIHLQALEQEKMTTLNEIVNLEETIIKNGCPMIKVYTTPNSSPKI